MGILDEDEGGSSVVAPPSKELQNNQTIIPQMPNYGQEITSDFLKYRIDNSEILEEFEHQLKGEVFVNGKWKPKFKRELTDEGISEIINIIYAFGLNKSTLLGNISHEEIYERCNSIWKEIAKYILLNGHRVGIERKKRSLLIRKIVYMIHSALSRSEAGKEATQLSRQSQRVEHFMHQDQQNKQSVMEKLNPFARR